MIAARGRLAHAIALCWVLASVWFSEGVPSFLVAPALGGEPAHIVLVDEGSPALARRLHAELRYAGFVVQGEEKRQGSPAEPGTVAVVRVASSERVHVSIVSALGTESRLFDAPESGRAEKRAALALRVVEQLHARLVQLHVIDAGIAAAPEPAVIAPPVETPSKQSILPAANVDAPTLWLVGGVGAFLAAGGVGVTPHALVGMRLKARPSLAVGLLAALPLMDREVVAAEGEADVFVNAFLLQGEYTSSWAVDWELSAGVCAGLLVMPLQSEAVAPFAGRADRLFAGLYGVQFSVARQLSHWLRMRLGVTGGSSAPRAVLRFDAREVASWGPGFGSLTLGVELGWPLTRGSEP